MGSSAQRMQKVHLVVNLSLWRLFGKGGGRVTRFTICVGKYVLLDQFREGGRALSENADGRDCAKSHSAGMPYTRLEFLLRNDNEKTNQFRYTCGRGWGSVSIGNSPRRLNDESLGCGHVCVVVVRRLPLPFRQRGREGVAQLIGFKFIFWVATSSPLL